MDETRMTELNKAIEGMWDSLTDEQKAAAKECKSMDELALLAGAAGVELPDEMLDAVAGGGVRNIPASKSEALKSKPGTWFQMWCPICHQKHETSRIAHQENFKLTNVGPNAKLTWYHNSCGTFAHDEYSTHYWGVNGESYLDPHGDDPFRC